MTHYGYCRLKKEDKNTDTQYEKLLSAGIPPENIYRDIIVGQSKRLPEYDKLMMVVVEDDIVSITDLDILGQTLEKRMISVLELFKKSIVLESYNDSIFSNSVHRFMKMAFMAHLGRKELSRNKPIRSMNGLKEAKKRGLVGGRTEGLTESAKITAKKVAKLYGTIPRVEIMKKLKISLATFYKYLRHEGIEIGDSFKPNKPENYVE